MSTPAVTLVSQPAPEQGGIFICTVPTTPKRRGWHLFAAPADLPEPLAWGPTDRALPGCDDDHDGLANTIAIVARGAACPAARGAACPAARACVDYRHAGFEDWYLPSRAELIRAWLDAPESFNTQGYYWSSTQYGRTNAFYQDFEYGYSDGSNKDHARRVRPFRRLFL